MRCEGKPASGLRTRRRVATGHPRQLPREKRTENARTNLARTERTRADLGSNCWPNYWRGIANDCLFSCSRMKTEPKYLGRKGWVCPVCRQARTAEGHDPCIPNLPGVIYACCGHGGTGVTAGYIYFENGVRIGMIVTDISYDDDRSRIDMPQALA